ncbi:Importin-11 [Anabarilius grahami]|uniref:Importin-11 n=1 Tax=Anabarilius grahami TaxID=495550 RepID=A0A3N0YRZ3_ANAGA|nr:Importin-11 [Anabarilius grahami]
MTAPRDGRMKAGTGETLSGTQYHRLSVGREDEGRGGRYVIQDKFCGIINISVEALHDVMTEDPETATFKE